MSVHRISAAMQWRLGEGCQDSLYTDHRPACTVPEVAAAEEEGKHVIEINAKVASACRVWTTKVHNLTYGRHRRLYAFFPACDERSALTVDDALVFIAQWAQCNSTAVVTISQIGLCYCTLATTSAIAALYKLQR